MTPASLHDLFFAAAGVSGALIGLLFVALSVERDRLTAADADQVQRVRARAALMSFTNALAVSLWSLEPGSSLADVSISVGTVGLLFVLASVLSVRRVARAGNSRTGRLRNLTFLALQAVVFALQIWRGVALQVHPHDSSAATNIATLVIICLFLGIYRSWELISGPEIGLGHELRELVGRPAGEPSEPPE